MRTATWWPGGEGRRPSLPVSVDVHSVLRRCLAVKRRVDHRRVSGLEVVCTPVSSVPLRTTSDTRCTSAMTEPSSVTSRSSAKISCLCNRLRLQVWNFARTCTLTTSRRLLNIKVRGQRSRSRGFCVSVCAWYCGYPRAVRSLKQGLTIWLNLSHVHSEM